MGTEAVKKLLQNIDLEKESKMLRRLKRQYWTKRVRTIRRLEVVEAFRKSEINQSGWY